MSAWPHFSWLFGWAWTRHLKRQHLADYEVCSDPLCRTFWIIEHALWYKTGQS